MPFRITSGPYIFQRDMVELLKGHTSVAGIMDDILVHGRDVQEHDERSEKVLKTTKDSSLCLNKEKGKLRQKELAYFGHIVSEDGIKPHPDKV